MFFKISEEKITNWEKTQKLSKLKKALPKADSNLTIMIENAIYNVETKQIQNFINEKLQNSQKNDKKPIAEMIIVFENHLNDGLISHIQEKIISTTKDILRGDRYTPESIATVDEMYQMIRESLTPDLAAKVLSYDEVVTICDFSNNSSVNLIIEDINSKIKEKTITISKLQEIKEIIKSNSSDISVESIQGILDNGADTDDSEYDTYEESTVDSEEADSAITEKISPRDIKKWKKEKDYKNLLKALISPIDDDEKESIINTIANIGEKTTDDIISYYSQAGSIFFAAIHQADLIKIFGLMTWTKKSSDFLLSLLTVNTDEYVLKQVIVSLGQLISFEAIPKLTKLLKSESEDIRSGAVEALGNIGDEGSLDNIIERLHNDENYFARGLAAKALGKINSHKSAEELITALATEENTFTRTLIYAGLGLLKSPLTVEAIRSKFIVSTDSDEKGNAAQTLGLIGLPDALDTLLEGLKDSFGYPKQQIAFAIGEIGKDTKNIDLETALLEALKDENSSYVIAAIITALVKIGTDKGKAIYEEIIPEKPDVKRDIKDEEKRLYTLEKEKNQLIENRKRAKERSSESNSNKESEADIDNTKSKPAKNKVLDIVENYINMDPPLSTMEIAMGLQSYKTVYKPVGNEISRSSDLQNDIKIVSVDAILTGRNINMSDPKECSLAVMEVIQHYINQPTVWTFFIAPYISKQSVIIEGEDIPIIERCRVNAGVENLLLELYNELPDGGLITDEMVNNKIMSFISD